MHPLALASSPGELESPQPMTDNQIPNDGQLHSSNPAPPSGPGPEPDNTARNRKIVIVVGTLVVLIAVVLVVALATSGSKKVASPTTTSTTSSSTSSTTSTTLDPRGRYIGVAHDTAGAGLPLGTSIQGYGFPSTDQPKVNEKMFYWVKDDKGSMLWVDTINKASDDGSIQSTVDAVFDIAAAPKDGYVCLGTCAKIGDPSPQPYVVAVVNSKNAAIAAYKIDVTSAVPTISALTASQYTGYDPTDFDTPAETPDDPARPALYGVVVNAKSSDQPWYEANEQLSVAGGGSGPDGGFIFEVRDRSTANTLVLVWQGTNKSINDTLVTGVSPDTNITFSFSSPAKYTYKGAADTNIIAVEDNGSITKAWRLDPTTHKFNAVDAADVKKA